MDNKENEYRYELLKNRIDHMEEDVKEFKDISKSINKMATAVEVLTKEVKHTNELLTSTIQDTKDSIQRLHERIDKDDERLDKIEQKITPSILEKTTKNDLWHRVQSSMINWIVPLILASLTVGAFFVLKTLIGNYT